MRGQGVLFSEKSRNNAVRIPALGMRNRVGHGGEIMDCSRKVTDKLHGGVSGKSTLKESPVLASGRKGGRLNGRTHQSRQLRH